ncbi:MFS transporter [Nocardia coffeae]|uniref:MFS transporter n=1 Tax=Nocardia coffeae TaxID=2873381 RepID=UPI001F379AF6|nr:MFS transporter [Nocardia coffeae]
MSEPKVVPVSPPPDEAPGRLRNYLMLIGSVLVLVELNAMCVQMVVPALRPMAHDFPVAGLGWVLTIVSLIGAAVMPLGGKLADKLQLRPLISGVGALFFVGNVLCAISTSFALLMVGRALQAVMLVMPAIAYCIFRDLLPARLLPVALGSLGTGLGLAGLVGPILAGALIDGLGYRSVFWFFAIYVVVVTPIVCWQIPRKTDRKVVTGKIDLPGVASLSVGIGLVLLGLTQGSEWGWTAPGTLGSLVVGLLLLALFVRIESRASDPIVDLRAFRTPAITLTLIVGFLGIVPIIAFSFAVPQLLQTPKDAGLPFAFGFGALAVGVAMIPYGAVGMILGPVGGALARRIPIRLVMVASLALLGAGMVLIALFHASLIAIIVWTLIIGAGFGLFWAAQPNLMVEAVPHDQTGVSAGVQTSVFALATAVTSALVGTTLANHVVAEGREGPVYGDTAFVIIFVGGAVAVALGIVVTLAMKHGRAPASGGSAVPTTH